MKDIPKTKYICKSSHANSYKITKNFNVNGKSKSFHYGSFKTLEEAIEYRDLCIERDWDEQLMPKNNPITCNSMRYIHKSPVGNYEIKKWENGKTVHYGTYHTLFDAIQERDLLIKHDWDYDAVCNIDERICGITVVNNRRV